LKHEFYLSGSVIAPLYKKPLIFMDKCKLKSIIIAQLTVIYDQGGNTVYMMLPGEEL